MLVCIYNMASIQHPKTSMAVMPIVRSMSDEHHGSSPIQMTTSYVWLFDFFFFLLHKHSSSSHTQNRQTSCPSGDGTWFTYSWWASMLWLTTSVLVLVGIITDLLVFLSLPSPVIRFGFFFFPPPFRLRRAARLFLYLFNQSIICREGFFFLSDAVSLTTSLHRAWCRGTYLCNHEIDMGIVERTIEDVLTTRTM